MYHEHVINDEKNSIRKLKESNIELEDETNKIDRELEINKIAYEETNLIEKVLLPGDKARIGQFSVISLLNALRLQLCKTLS